MTRRDPRGRPGITLTEILISIMILGIGMVSLATLFPIGLLRIRAADRASRSVMMGKLAINEIGVRDLFDHANFTFYPTAVWTADGAPGGVSRPYGTGLPVAYDPLWWSVTGQAPSVINFRFGASTYTMRPDPAGGTTSTASAGLQRITGSPTGALGTLEGIFVSPDNFVTQTDGGPTAPPTFGPARVPTGASPLVPDLSVNNNLQFDYAYTWLFTGQQSDAGDYSVFDGSIVVFNNRPFGVEGSAVSGERTVEATFAPGKPSTGGGSYAYSLGDPRVVWLRWPNSQPDPDIAVGSWIADVTYGVSQADDTARNSNPRGQTYPYQRCHWYQVARRTDADIDPDTTNFPNYRRTTVTLAAPVRAKTLLKNDGSGTPAYTNAALICPSVVNVFPRTFYNRR